MAVKTGEDPAPGLDHPLHDAAVGVVTTTNLEDAGAHHHILDLLHPHPDEDPLTTTPPGGVTTKGAGHLPHQLHPDPPQLHRPPPDQNPAPHHPNHDITRKKGEKIVLNLTLRTEVTGAVGATGTEDHLLIRVEHMLMRTRPDVKEAIPTTVAAAGIVHVRRPDTGLGAEVGAALDTTATKVLSQAVKGQENEVEKTRKEGKGLIVLIGVIKTMIDAT